MSAKRKVQRAARRLFRLCVADGLLDETRVRQVAHGLASSGRRGALPLLSQFQRLVRLDHDRRTAVVQSATPLVADLRQEVQTDLAHRYGRGIQAVFSEDPALIGGMRIRIGSDVYDSSVKARLAALEARL